MHLRTGQVMALHFCSLLIFLIGWRLSWCLTSFICQPRTLRSTSWRGSNSVCLWTPIGWETSKSQYLPVCAESLSWLPIKKYVQLLTGRQGMLAGQYLRLPTQIIYMILVFCPIFSTRLPLIQLHQSINWGICWGRRSNNRDDINQRNYLRG